MALDVDKDSKDSCRVPLALSCNARYGKLLHSLTAYAPSGPAEQAPTQLPYPSQVLPGTIS